MFLLNDLNTPHWDKMNMTFIYYANVMLSRVPIATGRVSSSFRTPAENKAAGGVWNSKHLTGEAVDLVIERASKDQMFYASRGLPLDVIKKPDHYHIELDYKNQFFVQGKNGGLNQKTLLIIAGAFVLGLIILY